MTDDPTGVLVTGGSGFLGRRVLPLLVESGARVTALARSAAAADVVATLGAEPLPGDLDEPATIDKAFAASGAGALVNIASMGFGHAPTIVAAAEEHGLQRAIFVSTTSIYTNLPSPSRSTRLAAEHSVAASNLDWTIVRPTMIYGRPDDRNMARLLGLLRRTPVVPLPGGGRGLQQPVHVDDLAHAIAAALDRPATIRRSYDLAGPRAHTLRQIVAEAGAAVGRDPVVVPVPLRPTIAAARLYERTAKRPRLSSEQVARLAEDKAVDIDEARADLGFDPREFAEGIRAEARMMRGA